MEVELGLHGGIRGTHHSHLAEGALHTVGHGHSGWTHVSVSLYEVVNGPANINKELQSL